MRKPSPIKVVDYLDERVSIRGNEIEISGIMIDVRRAERLAAWIMTAVAWINEQENGDH